MQQAFIDHDALQCGYCTPGQIMAAVACVDEGHASSPEQIREYMSGNICRCGAYVGIVAAIEDAAPKMRRAVHASFRLYKTRKRRGGRSRDRRAAGPGTRFLAGGTTLYDLMKLNVETPSSIVDINSLAELNTFDTSGSSELVFGALARMSDVAADPGLIRDYPALSESLWKAASQQLRNMASLGGNLLQRTRCAYFRGGEPFACNKRSPAAVAPPSKASTAAMLCSAAARRASPSIPATLAVALVAFDAKY